MSQQSKKVSDKQLQREFIKVGIIDAPGSILIGLGLYGKFAANGDAFHPFLNSDSNLNAMLAVGGAIWAWGMYRIIKITMKKRRPQSNSNVDPY